MKFNIIVVSLVVMVVGGGVFFGLRLADLSQQINVLKVDYKVLQSSHHELQLSYNTLETTYQTVLSNYNLLDSENKILQTKFNSLNTDFALLTNKYDELESDYVSLTNKYNKLELDYISLESDYNSLQSSYNKLDSKVTTLEINNNQLQTENTELRRLLTEYERVPNSYYSSGNFQQHSNTWAELGNFLAYEFALPTGYTINVFDCSESTAYLEWALENAGFDAEICTGPTPWNPSSGYHAWVIARTAEYQVAIEATSLTGEYNWSYLFNNRIPGVVYKDDSLIPGWNNYYDGYDNKYQNIFLAIRDWDTIREWNWWEGFWGFS